MNIEKDEQNSVFYQAQWRYRFIYSKLLWQRRRQVFFSSSWNI